MAITKDEAWDDLRNAQAMEDQAREELQQNLRKRSNCEEEIDIYQAKVRNCCTEKYNLEERKERIKKLVENILQIDDQVETNNKSAKKANKNYKTVILCNQIDSASITIKYETFKMQEESNTKSALEKCDKEIQNLSESIKRLNKKITELKSVLNGLNSTLRGLDTQIERGGKTVINLTFETSARRRIYNSL